MRVPDKLKLNKFIEVSIPRPMDTVRRLGLHELPAQEYSGEDEQRMYSSKADALQESDKLYEQYAKEASE